MKGKLSRLVMAGLVMGSVVLPLTGFAQGVKLSALRGTFTVRDTGSFAVCLNPTTFAPEGCTTSGVLIYPLTIVGTSVLNRDSKGNTCETGTDVTAALPPNAQPSSPGTNITVGKLTDYDPTTGEGDYALTGYSGGKCNGSSFDSSGATKTATDTVHIQATSADRVDIILTSYTAIPVSFIESFILSGYELRQK
ncbi:MAG: hypothetical protein JO071_16785 [Deltaproteobacteria bacterium]|nr:hypothetical protein [Deltaproteobacteria bacterium]